MIFLTVGAFVGVALVGWVVGLWTRKWTLGGCRTCGWDLVCANCLRTVGPPGATGRDA
jgi:hypothetical protein